jgi:hypothetical protein
MKELMGTLSPAYGMIKGEGLFGNAVGLLPAIAKDARGDRQKKKDEEAAKASGAFVEKDNPNPTKKSQATVKKGNPAAIDTMLRKAFRAIDLEKAREGKKGLMTPSEARERTDNARELNKAIQSSAKSGGSRGGSGIGGGGGMFPDTEKVPGKRPLQAMKKGGMVKSSASKRADGIVKKGKTRGRMV